MSKPFSFAESLRSSDLDKQKRRASATSSLLSKSESELAFSIQHKVATPANTPVVRQATPRASTKPVTPLNPTLMSIRTPASLIQVAPSKANTPKPASPAVASLKAASPATGGSKVNTPLMNTSYVSTPGLGNAKIKLIKSIFF